ncbi:RTX-I toxin determinant A from serotypes 1/9 [Roseovarius litorisediminis]|uniref:RTX-I toxin determinant A from serotypes 1/9 n=1 Tax=Roseovarius litorisediminis TaxID=1312363 RepID=A0A1Y5RJ41_9RHOB|nr:RTX-I toxin determinant A from serotypes 1/9 [Roseovarius litorisediminis]
MTVNVGAVNDAPVAQDDSAVTAEDSNVQIAVLDNDSDVDGDTLSVTQATAQNGTVLINADGTLSYSPDADFNGTDTIGYTVSDGQGGSDTATVTVTVTPVKENSGKDDPDIVNGTEGDDRLLGGASADQINGLGGNDLIKGAAGDDTIFGGEGNDTLEGGSGDDFLSGGSGVNSLNGGQGDDRLEWGGSDDVYNGDVGRDVLVVAAGSNVGSDLLPTLKGSDIEAIDLENTSSETLNVTFQDVIGLSSKSDTLLEQLLGKSAAESATIYGDSSDTVNLAGDPAGTWSFSDSVNDGVNDFDVYEFVDGSSNVLATLAIDDDVSVSLPVV